jgi:C_GCAxxG_C_C family probable redox protein
MGESDETEAVDAVVRATRLYEAGLSCAPAILAAFAPRFGLNQDQAARVASCFGGGMIRSGGPCGAVTGSLMAIGLAFGPGLCPDSEAKERAYRHAAELWQRVRERWGSLQCRDILGVDISSPAGHAQAKAEKLFSTRCKDVIRTAAEVVNELVELKGSRDAS